MITYNWSVIQLTTMPQLDGKSDVVITAFYKVAATEENFSASTSQYQSFAKPGEDFTPYNELTESQVIGWIKESLGENGVNSIEEGLAAQIENQKNPPLTPEVLPLPWTP